VSLIVNNEENLIKELADSGDIISVILEAFTSATLPFIKTDDSHKATWSTMGGKFTTTETGICL
jgi:hypothetical protein